MEYEICLRLTTEQAQKLSADARRCGLSKSVFLRRLIMEKEVRPSREKEINKLIAEINKIGSNVNQVARAANTGQLTKEQAQKLDFMLAEIYALLGKVARN